MLFGTVRAIKPTGEDFAATYRSMLTAGAIATASHLQPEIVLGNFAGSILKCMNTGRVW